MSKPQSRRGALRMPQMLDQRVNLEYPQETRDSLGGVSVAWVLLREVWASVSPIKGRELLNEGANLNDMDTRILIRFAPDLQTPELIQLGPKWRVVHRGIPYNIYSVAESNMGREHIEIMAKTGLNNG